MEHKKSTQKRMLLLEAALDVFSKYGFNGASLDEIAQTADMHKSNIFYYYANKEDLYVAVVTSVLQKWMLPMQDIDPNKEPVDALTEYLKQKIEASRAQPKASKLFALEIIQGAPHILTILKGPLKKLFKNTVKTIQTWQEQNKIAKQVDAELLILNMWALTQNYADFDVQMESLLGKTLSHRNTYQKAVEHSIYTLLYGVIPRNN